MKVRRLVALVTSVACVAGVQPGVRAGVLADAARANTSDAQQAPVAPISGQRISGKVLRADRKTVVPNHSVVLRSLDNGTIVGRTVTDGTGAFSFNGANPGRYVVEAVSGAGRIVAVGNPVTLLNLPATTNVILPLDALVSSTVFAIAAAAGILGWVASKEGPTSPER